MNIAKVRSASQMVCTLVALSMFISFIIVPPVFAQSEQQQELKVATYNIAAGTGPDGQFDLERTAQTIRTSGADIVGLQEVDVHWGSRSDFVDEVNILADALDMEAFFAPIYDMAPGQPDQPRRQFGVAVLSKYPIVNATNHEITRLSTQDPNPEPKPSPGFLEALIDVNGTPVWFYVTHLDYRGDPTIREMQVADMQRVMSLSNNSILVGDMNARPDAKELEPLFEMFTDVWTVAGDGNGYTFPADSPDRRIDYILTSPEIAVESAAVEPSLASDHLLVTSSMSLNPVSAATMQKLVERFETEEAFANDGIARSLNVHLTAVNRYEEKGLTDKVIKHMESFTMLLNHQKDNEWISERAYNALKVEAEALLKRYSYFPWGVPGPSSPVLHAGGSKSAGMDPQPLNDLDSEIENAIAENVMPGAVAFIARKGVIVKHDAYGYAARYEDDTYTEMDDPLPMKVDTIFDLASISKLFTTTAAMKLYEQGKFELDDPVAKYIPEFAQNGKSEVTIRQLMTHTSGFRAWIPLYQMGENREDRLNIVLTHPLDHEPGTSYTYSDLNLITLGVLVERLSGQRLDTFVKETITAPLGMNDTMYNPPASIRHRIAATEYQPWTDRGLVWGEVHDENAWALDGVAGHAGIFSTARDLAVFAHMLLQDGEYDGQRILEPETVELLEENQLPQFPGNDHSLGWELNQTWYMDALSEKNTLGHTGYTGTSVVVSPNNDTIAILLTNRVHPSRDTVSTNGIRRQIARLTADSIPVPIPKGGTAWFSGYGDHLDATLTASVELEQDARLTFDTWYLTEHTYDDGIVEISTDGREWTQIGETLTGISDGWVENSWTVPQDTRYIRFKYRTDASGNGRGWYVYNPRLLLSNGDIIEPKWESLHWRERSR